MESAGPPCKHEFVRIYQRKLKGLERRLVATKAYLPVGFKQADFGHLSEGSYCFCTKCRARLYPKRTNADKAAARLANQAKALGLAAAQEASESESSDLVDFLLAPDEAGEEGVLADDDGSKSSAAISVEELDLDAGELEENEVEEDDDDEES